MPIEAWIRGSGKVISLNYLYRGHCSTGRASSAEVRVKVKPRGQAMHGLKLDSLLNYTVPFAQ